MRVVRYFVKQLALIRVCGVSRVRYADAPQIVIRCIVESW